MFSLKTRVNACLIYHWNCINVRTGSNRVDCIKQIILILIMDSFLHTWRRALAMKAIVFLH